MDGVQKEQWSGEQGWVEETYTIAPGQHTFKWAYEKDGSVSSGSDCAWIDRLYLYKYTPPITFFDPDEYTVALWHLNGNGEDDSGNGNHLTVKTDRVDWVDGEYGQAALMGVDPWSGSCFNSDGGALTAPGAGCSYPGSGDWTLEAWVKFEAGQGGTVICHYSEHWAGHEPYYLSIGSDGVARFDIQDGSNNATISADISTYAGQWIHLAGVYRHQQDLEMYLNGQRIAYNTTAIVPEYLPGYDVYVGGSFCGTSTGLIIDEARISTSARYTD